MRILVAGAGISGLGAALALTGEGRTVEIIERDSPPPNTDPNGIFDTWKRLGVAHLRHSHGFMARLTGRSAKPTCSLPA